MTLSAQAATSSRSCELKTRVRAGGCLSVPSLPPFTHDSSDSMRSRRPLGSSPAPGSSKMSKEGDSERMPAIATRLCSPTERARGEREPTASTSKPTVVREERTMSDKSCSETPQRRGAAATSSHTLALKSRTSGRCKTMPTVPGAGRSLPRVETLPLPGGMRPAISSRSVVLPAAVGPATAETLPKGTSSETSANASRANGLPVLYSRHTRSKTTAAVFSAVKLPHSFHHSAHHCLKFAFSQRRGVPTHQITPKDLPQLLRHRKRRWRQK